MDRKWTHVGMVHLYCKEWKWLLVMHAFSIIILVHLECVSWYTSIMNKEHIRLCVSRYPSLISERWTCHFANGERSRTMLSMTSHTNCNSTDYYIAWRKDWKGRFSGVSDRYATSQIWMLRLLSGKIINGTFFWSIATFSIESSRRGENTEGYLPYARSFSKYADDRPNSKLIKGTWFTYHITLS